MTFAAPLWLAALALVPLLCVFFFGNESKRRDLLAKLVAARLRDRLAGSVSVAKRRWRFALLMLGLAALIASLARPQYGFTWREAKRSGRDVIIAIDTSKSMLATDLAPNRLTRAKLAAQDLVGELRGDRVGVIAFAGTSFLQAPLTADYSAVNAALQELDTEIIPQGGTNIAGAILEAVDAFGKGESEHRALVIFTDGEELDANGIREAEKHKDDVKIFTVGLGSPDGALLPLRGPGGGTEFLKDADGQIVKSRLDEERLRRIAEAAGGFYVRLLNSREQMTQIVRDGLAKMTEHEIDTKLSRQPIERYQWPLGAGLLLLAASMLIGERRRVVRLAVLAIVLLPAMASGKSAGVEAYERQQYDKAKAAFEKQLKLRPNSPELHYDLGTAAYQMGDYDHALDAFSKAVTARDSKLNAKAEYNLGNTLFKRGATLQDREPKIQEWKNALQHYDQALKIEPKNADAQHNRDVVAKLIEEMEKQQQQKQQQKDKQEKKDNEEKQDQQEQQQQQGGDQNDQKDQQQQDQQQQQQQQQQQSSDSQKQDGKEGEQKDANQQPGKDGEQKDSEKKDGKSERPDDAQHQPPQPEKEGEIKDTQPLDRERKDDKEAAEKAEAAAAAAAGKMTPQQAKALLDSLRSEDVRVHLLEPREPKQPSRVKRDW